MRRKPSHPDGSVLRATLFRVLYLARLYFITTVPAPSTLPTKSEMLGFLMSYGMVVYLYELVHNTLGLTMIEFLSACGLILQIYQEKNSKSMN